MQFYSSKTSIAERQHLVFSYLGLCVSFVFHTTVKKYEARTLSSFFPQVCQNKYGTFHFMITTTTTIIIMPTSTTSTNNTYSVIMFFMMMITFFACFLIFVLIFFQDGGRIFRFHSVSTKQRQLRQQEIVGL